jgi:hypothetical protein
VCDKETTNEVQGEREKLEPLIWWLKNTTGFHLQAFTLKQRIDKAFTTLWAIHQTLNVPDQEATQIKARHGKKTLDQAAVGTWALWHGSWDMSKSANRAALGSSTHSDTQNTRAEDRSLAPYRRQRPRWKSWLCCTRWAEAGIIGKRNQVETISYVAATLRSRLRRIPRRRIHEKEQNSTGRTGQETKHTRRILELRRLNQGLQARGRNRLVHSYSWTKNWAAEDKKLSAFSWPWKPVETENRRQPSLNARAKNENEQGLSPLRRTGEPKLEEQLDQIWPEK